MIIQYLKQDIKSYQSSYFYGRKGDKVTVIGSDVSGLVKVISERGNMYYAHDYYLSIETVAKDPEPIKSTKKIRPR